MVTWDSLLCIVKIAQRYLCMVKIITSEGSFLCCSGPTGQLTKWIKEYRNSAEQQLGDSHSVQVKT